MPAPSRAVVVSVCLLWALFCALVPHGRGRIELLVPQGGPGGGRALLTSDAYGLGWPVPSLSVEVAGERVAWRLNLPALVADLVAGLGLAALTLRLFQRRARERSRLREGPWIAFLLLNLSFPLWRAAGGPAPHVSFTTPGRVYLGAVVLAGFGLAAWRHARDRARP